MKTRSILTVRNSNCGKFMFLHQSVSHSLPGVACVAGGCMAGQGGMRGRGGMHGWGGRSVAEGMRGRGGACMAGRHGRGGMHGRGHAWQERRPLQRTVRIHLECILV